MAVLPPKPLEVAERVITDVTSGVRFDLGAVCSELREHLREDDDEEYVWPRAERIAAASLRTYWPDELEEQCRRALADAHELALMQADGCLAAAHDLEDRGLESWIAGAVLHHLACDAAWEVVPESLDDLDEHDAPG
jgi:hypothetical protein